MVGVAFGANLVASGLAFYALPRLLQPLASAYTDGERGPVMLLGLAMSIAGMAAGPLIGRELTRRPLGLVMAVGAVVLGLGFLVASQANAFWLLLVVYAIAVPIGVGTMSSIGANALVGNWFDRQRPLALGVSQFGLSIAGALAVFFISWTLGWGGLGGTYLAFAAIAFVSAPLLWWSITDRPAELGMAPDGAPPDESATAAAAHPADWTFRAALREPDLWLAGMTAGLCFLGATAVLQNGHAFATDAGYGDSQANFFVSAMAVGAAFGKLLFGALGVRFGERASFAIAIVAEGAFLLLLVESRASIGLLVAAGLGLGLALGGVMPALAALLARLFGTARFGPAMGYVAPMMIPLQMLGAPIAAFVWDETGSYDPAIYGFGVACGVALLLLFRIEVAPAAPAHGGRAQAAASEPDTQRR